MFKLRKDYQGLKDDEVLESRNKYGSAKVEEEKPPTFLERLKDCYGDKCCIVMIICMIIGYITSYIDVKIPTDALSLTFMLVLIGIITIGSNLLQERDFKNLKESIAPPKIVVKRNGVIQQVSKDDIVVGDLIQIEAGSKSFFDCYVVDGELTLNNSQMSGESDDIKVKSYDGNITLGESNSKLGGFVYDGSEAKGGKAWCIVVNVGENTISGKAKAEVDEVEEQPLTTKLNKLTDQISIFGYCGGLIILLSKLVPFITCGLYKEESQLLANITAILMPAVSIVMASVPEGLSMLKTTVLAKFGRILKKKNVLVKNINKGETPGSLSQLYTDKTGTITFGKPVIIEFFDAFLNDTSNNNNVKPKILSAIVNNISSSFDDKGNIINGNSSDQAFLQYVGKDAYDEYKEDDVKLQLFSSDNKYSAGYVPSMNCTYYKGAPEVIMNKAKRCMDGNGNIVDIDEDRKVSIMEKISRGASRCIRYIAIGVSEKELVENSINDDIILIGVFGIRDDIRPTSKEAIKLLNKAGVKVTMATGDNSATATAIAKEIGLIKDSNDLCFTNDEIESMSDNEILEVIDNIRVISRCMPGTKRRMAELAQRKGHVVGMTGDGVNDAPALKQADVGFAMGSGTNIAKDAGDIILVDDNLMSIVESVKTGRTIVKNIQKFLKYQLSINVGIVISSIISMLLLGLEDIPMTVTAVLWINAIMDTFASLAFSGEPTEEQFMLESPIDRNANIITKEMIGQIILSSLCFIGFGTLYLVNPSIKEVFGDAHFGGYFTLFTLMAVFNGFNVRSNTLNLLEKYNENKDFFIIMFGIFLAQLLIVNFGGVLFGVIPMNMTQWAIILLMSILIIPIDIIRKIVVRLINK